MLIPLSVSADEGMWLVHSFRETIYKQMKKTGLKLKPEEIYNESAPALSDAIVAVDGGQGTGSMISAGGLMITNHHVAYSDIAELSTPENNYLENGFWARTAAEEIPIPGKTVTFLRKVVDITDEAKALRAEMEAEGKWTIMSPRRLAGILEKRYAENTEYEVSFSSFFRGEQYVILFYEIFTDVRLVGAPPVTIGAFGGETDNWGWPQHKGDFALYRVYTDKDGKPAPYSKDNVAMNPDKYLSISTGGIKEGDYTMIMGYPGRTSRYQSSFAVTEKEKVVNPIVASRRRSKLDVMKKHMEADPNVRLAYADQYFSISNYTDYAKWENICLRRYGVADIRAAEEAELQKWIDADPARTEKYGGVLDRLAKGYPARANALKNHLYFRESWFGQSAAMNMGSRISGMVGRFERRAPDVETLDFQTTEVRDIFRHYNRIKDNFDYDTDKDIMKDMFADYTANVDRAMWGDVLPVYYDRFGGNIDAMTEWIYETSFCPTPERFEKFFTSGRTMDEIKSDPIVALNGSLGNRMFTGRVEAAEKRVGAAIDDDEPLYQRAVYDYRASMGIPQYPNANSTMRITYGTVGPVRPYDAVFYDYRSTAEGILEKYNPDDYEFRVDRKQLDLIRAADWGRWGEKGKLYVDFLSNNDITGGNSGSPIMNARGHIIGLAFDGNRESIAADVYFHPSLAKCVSVDIRYVLWVIDKFAGAGWLIDEMNLVK